MRQLSALAALLLVPCASAAVPRPYPLYKQVRRAPRRHQRERTRAAPPVCARAAPRLALAIARARARALARAHPSAPKQCDPRWGNDTMVTTTICAVGCLMSSTSMALAGHGITVAGSLATPGTLNVSALDPSQAWPGPARRARFKCTP